LNQDCLELVKLGALLVRVSTQNVTWIFVLILERYILLLTQTARKNWTIFSIQILPRYTWFQLVWQVRIC